MTGGHLLSGTVSLTAEIIIHGLNIKTERTRDDELGINLIGFDV